MPRRSPPRLSPPRRPAPRRTLLACGLAAALAAVPALAGCGSDAGGGSSPAADGGPVPGVTDTTVTIGTHHPLTGPAAAGYSQISPATKAYFAYVNAGGGVNGRTIVYEVRDDGYNPAKTQEVVRQLVLQDKVFAIVNGLGTPTHTGVLDFLTSNDVPDLFVASGSRSWNQPDKHPNTFGFNPDYTVEGKILGSYVKESLPGKKVCFLGQDDDLGRDSLAGLEKVLGADAVAERQTYVVTNQNVAPQVGALKAAGCQVVVLATVPGFTALSIGTAARLGFSPQWVVTNIGGDYATLAATLGDAAPLLEGLVSINYQPSHFGTSDPWSAKFREINAQYNEGAAFNGNTVYGMMVGYLFVQALQAAGRDLTRESLLAAVAKGGFTGPGLVPLRYSDADHSGYAGGRMTKVSGGTQEYFGPTYTTDDGDGAVVEYTGTRPDPGTAIPQG